MKTLSKFIIAIAYLFFLINVSAQTRSAHPGSTGEISGYGTGNGNNGGDDGEPILHFDLKIPPSPTAATLGNYTNVINNNLFTGTVGFSIPVTSISNGSISQNLTLSYSSNGIQVESARLPGRWGNSWNVSAGGVISRTVNGNTFDDEAGGFLFNWYYNQIATNNIDRTLLWNIEHEYLDAEPDVFSFNFEGYSGAFYLRPLDFTGDVLDESHVVMVPSQNLRIIPELSDNGSIILQFKIITPEGYQYFFTEIEHTYIWDHPTKESLEYVSAWFLSKIESPNGNIEFTFNYIDESLNYGHSFNQSATYKEANNINNIFNYEKTDQSFSDRTVDTKLLTKIVGRNQTIVIEDIYAPAWIKTYNNSDLNIPVSIFELYYYAFGPYVLVSNLAQIDCINQDIEPIVYSFDYYGADDSQFLNKTYSTIRNAQDIWGYYNGVDYNESLIPSMTINGRLYNQGRSGNRLPSFDNNIKGMLKKITYPTKGYSEMEYEQHLFDNNSAFKSHFPDIQSSGNNVYGGGLRLKSKKNYDANGTFVSAKKYLYSSGKMFTPNVEFYYNSFHYTQVPVGTIGSETIETQFITIPSNPMPGFGTTNGSYVGYKIVNEYEMDSTDHSTNGLTSHSFYLINDESFGSPKV